MSPNATASAAPVPREGVDSPGPGNHIVELGWNGQQRRYRVHAPANYDRTRPIPVVFGLHYYPGDGEGVAALTALDAKADTAGFLAVYPDGHARGFNALVCCGQQDDVGFIRTVVERLRTWNADPRRIYVTGISNGADMAFRLAVELPDTFAAIAPVSGGFGGDKARDPAYAPKSPVSVITFLGARDSHLTAFDAGLVAWRQRLGCTETNAVDVTPTVGRTSATCRDGSQVVVYRLQNMGHEWPGATTGRLAAADAGVNATDLIWEFFAAHAR